MRMTVAGGLAAGLLVLSAAAAISPASALPGGTARSHASVRAYASARLIASAMPGTRAQAASDQSARRPAWRVQYRVRVRGANLVALAAPAKNDAWAVGFVGHPGHRPAKLLVLHWNGHDWKQVNVPHPARFLPYYAAASSPDAVWIFGYLYAGPGDTGAPASAALRYDGSAWQTTSPASASNQLGNFDPGSDGTPTRPVALANGDAEAVGAWSVDYPQYPDGANLMLRWADGAWSTAHIRTAITGCGAIAGGGRQVWIVSAPSGTSCARNTFHPLVSRLDGTRLVTLPAPERTVGWASLAASPRGRLWLMAGDVNHTSHSRLDYWTGTRWIRRALPAAASDERLAYDGHGGVWADADAHWTGKRWVFPISCDLSAPCPGDATPVAGSTSVWALSTAANSNNATEIDLLGRTP